MSRDHNCKTKVSYCVGRTCHLTGLCFLVYDELLEYFDPEQIEQSPCMKKCSIAGAFRYEGQTFTSRDLNLLEGIVCRRPFANGLPVSMNRGFIQEV